MQPALSRTIVITVVAILLAAPLAWGGCDNDNCRNQENQPQEAVPAPSTPVKTSPQSRSREMNISDFVSSVRSTEKGCETSNCGHSPEQQEQPRTQEKKCTGSPNCD
ncbi:hypothetical protein OR1_03494 [Geobacter sp. OR-1]|uniref:hypothetical protein n=1 Tax=Geobacter sp. OR-1 TaxID=1266765 RepID=UPI000541A9DB|nr:hypothetical protein [Geobacter sp. OR-1]GAM11184.1 hypothetical protein OR1_03494 [Geobacter sp. OR-1]